MRWSVVLPLLGLVGVGWPLMATGGCGSADCSETATCSATSVDGSSGQDVSVGADATADGMQADGGADTAPPKDASFEMVPFDAFVGPDSPVDSSCATGTGENCTNGIDDNCDGLVDCADPLCAPAYGCDPPAPSGWRGPIELLVNSSSVPACASPYADDVVDGNAGLNAPMAQCTCQCGAVSGVDCGSAAQWFLYTDNACGSECDSKVMPGGVANFCESTSGCSGGGASIKSAAAPPLLNLASCKANPTTTLPPLSWQQVARGCAYSGPIDPGGCTGGATCVARATQGKACIYATGDMPCPPGAYSVQNVFYASAMDSRTCTACSCGMPTGVSCQVSGTLFTFASGGGACSGTATGSTSAFDGTTCTPLGGGGAASGVEGLVTTSASGGSCAPSGGTASGTVTGSQPTTVCCQP